MAEYSTHTAQFLALCVVVIISSLAVTLLAMSVESLMAYDTPDSEKGRAAGWFQAGNLGGSGIGGGAALWLAQRVSIPWLPGAALGACFAICCLVLLFVAEPHGAAHDRGIADRLLNVAKDLWRVSCTSSGYLALLVVFLPIGTGAASNLFAAVAPQWNASALTVAVINGALGGAISALG